MGDRLKISPAKGDFLKVVYFTDAHNQPDLDQRRFLWLSRLVNREKPDWLIDGGDFDDVQSACAHEKDDTLKGRLKPSLLRDLECAVKARDLINDCLTVSPRKHITLGNHENRIWVYENLNPAAAGLASNTYLDVLKKTGWEHSMYGEYFHLEGVDFTHCPFNGMGKPVGGDNIAKQAAEKSIHDVVFGHTHALGMVTAHKFGPGRSVTAYNMGCYMPDGYIPDYCKNTRKEFWYGAHVLLIRDGRIRSVKSFQMGEMEHLFDQRVSVSFSKTTDLIVEHPRF